MNRLILIFIIIFGLWSHFVSAQGLPQDIDITLYPSEPKPGQSVTATAQSFGMDLNSSTVTWTYNGTTLSVGTGKTSVVFTAPSSSTVATLSVSASGQGGTASSSLIIRSASVDVIWEAIDSYTPPFYKGKALAPIGGKIRITAIPSATAPKTLSYSWQYNGDAVLGQSGSNKTSLTIKTDVLGTNESFSVKALGGSFTGSGSTQVQLRDPQILLYQKSNGFIDYGRGSIRDVYITTPGITLRAEPFNFSITNSIDKSVSIGFMLNGQSFVGTSNAQELSITRPDSTGNSPFSVTATSLRERLQTIKRSFILHF